MFGPLLKLVNDQTGRDYIEADFLQDPFHGPQVFQIPLASKRQVLGGDNIFRDGADIVATKRENAGLQIQTGFQECDFEKLMALKAKMERLCEQARLRSEKGWGPKVELQWRPEGKYYARYADILDGDLDMPMNWLKMETPRHTVRPEDCILSLIRKPYWREDEETLENWVENPSFLLTQGGYVYEPAFGFDAWSSVNGATGGIDTVNWIQGGQSAHIICPAGGGIDVMIETDEISEYTGWLYVEAWVWHRGGNRITMRMTDPIFPWTPVVQWTYAGGVPVVDEQARHIDEAWREPGFIRKGFVFYWPAPYAAPVRLQIGVTAADDVGGDTDFNVDRVYLTEAANLNWTAEADRVLDPTTDWKEVYSMPRAWCSGREITGHTDLGTCVHDQEQPNLPGYENHIAYLDVEDIPGNLEAPMDLEAQLISIGKITEYPGGGGNPNRWHDWYVGRRTQDDLRNFVWEYDALHLDDLGTTPFNLVADAYAPSCERAEAAVVVVDYLGWNLANAEDLYGDYQAYLLAYATVDPSQYRVAVSQTFNQDWTDYVTIVGTGPFFRIHNLGLLRFPGVVEPSLPWSPTVGAPPLAPQIRLDCRRDGGAATLRIAGLILIPVSEPTLFVSDLAYAIDTGGMMGQQIQVRRSVYWITSARGAQWQLNYTGQPVSLMPGEWNRLINLSGIREAVYFPGTSYLFAPALVQELRLRYEPRFL